MSDVSEDDIDNISQFYTILCDLIPLGNWRTTLKLINSREMTHFDRSLTPQDKGSVVKDRKHNVADILLNLDIPVTNEDGDKWEHTVINGILKLVTDELCEYIEHRNPSLKTDDLYKTKLERTLHMLTYGYYNALAVGLMANGKGSSQTYANEIDPETKHNCEVM